jgi:hypothetical protein
MATSSLYLVTIQIEVHSWVVGIPALFLGGSIFHSESRGPLLRGLLLLCLSLTTGVGFIPWNRPWLLLSTTFLIQSQSFPIWCCVSYAIEKVSLNDLRSMTSYCPIIGNGNRLIRDRTLEFKFLTWLDGPAKVEMSVFYKCFCLQWLET